MYYVPPMAQRNTSYDSARSLLDAIRIKNQRVNMENQLKLEEKKHNALYGDKGIETRKMNLLEEQYNIAGTQREADAFAKQAAFAKLKTKELKANQERNKQKYIENKMRSTDILQGGLVNPQFYKEQAATGLFGDYDSPEEYYGDQFDKIVPEVEVYNPSKLPVFDYNVTPSSMNPQNQVNLNPSSKTQDLNNLLNLLNME